MASRRHLDVSWVRELPTKNGNSKFKVVVKNSGMVVSTYTGLELTSRKNGTTYRVVSAEPRIRIDIPRNQYSLKRDVSRDNISRSVSLEDLYV